ncbi:Glycerophosphodiester phosphodiesterase [Quillaja saponaria]|uniref:glycerophosphodiester phosphodiesterase n=1 Tax=Quillaja saponaria TaxID=32244 RepID=A0AAD7LMY9_QUISA|nr:Glycerophosphodiester phosphodiesterase [Quillaja saponaria]
MRSSRAQSHVLALLLLHSLVFALVSAQGSTRSPWQTLNGSQPLVVAHGGFSGIFPDSSLAAYNLALLTSVPDVIVWCDVQLTKDAAGICFPDLNLSNATTINDVFGNKTKVYLVNGVPTTGYFPVDYTLADLSNVILTQGVFSRPSKFDGSGFPILTVEDVHTQLKPPGLWLNIQHDQFFMQHNLSMRNFVLSVSRRVIVKYISSPEVGFLRGIMTRFNPRITKLFFRFLGRNEIEPSTNQTYDSLLKNLTFIKTFASGILVPKDYIWPVDGSLYLQPHTSVVLDAHKEGLEVFASNFVNDVPFSFNYSYDPLAEYLSFIDNGDFSVDGVVSDFPITPSEAIDCFAHLGKNAYKARYLTIDFFSLLIYVSFLLASTCYSVSVLFYGGIVSRRSLLTNFSYMSHPTVKTLVISKYGSSGDYPACTNLAYEKAISDGVDVLDCPVQMSKDGIPFCLSSVNLIDSTTIAQSSFLNLSTTIPEIHSGSGIFTFSLSANDIKSLTPQISSPSSDYKLFRNPKEKNAGALVTLADFLALTKNRTSLSGILIIIENAAYLAKEGLGVTDAVVDALSKAGYDKPGAQKVLIQSTNKSVLTKFKENNNYELVYEVDETIRDASDSAVEDIKAFADSVVVKKASVFPQNSAFLLGPSNTVLKLQSFNLSVYVGTFSNEFVSQAWDFFSDATVEINSFVTGSSIDGVITDFPKTAARYRTNRCLNLGNNTPAYMTPVQPGGLIQLITPQLLPPAASPLPVLTDSDVSEPPLPPVSDVVPTSSPGAGFTPAAQSPRNAQPKIAVCFYLSSLAVLLASLILLE